MCLHIWTYIHPIYICEYVYIHTHIHFTHICIFVLFCFKLRTSQNDDFIQEPCLLYQSPAEWSISKSWMQEKKIKNCILSLQELQVVIFNLMIISLDSQTFLAKSNHRSMISPKEERIGNRQPHGKEKLGKPLPLIVIYHNCRDGEGVGGVPINRPPLGQHVFTDDDLETQRS